MDRDKDHPSESEE